MTTTNNIASVAASLVGDLVRLQSRLLRRDAQPHTSSCALTSSSSCAQSQDQDTAMSLGDPQHDGRGDAAYGVTRNRFACKAGSYGVTRSRIRHPARSRRISFLKAFVAGLLLAAPVASLALTPISDQAMSDVTGQALLISDYIAPGSIGTDPNTQMDIGFYRMGLDATVETNVNINKLQLGCGGFNNNIKVGCDIDLDYVTMLGKGTGTNQPYQTDAFGNSKKNTDSGDPATSSFSMTRPYVAIAVANPTDPSKREVVGFKFGAQSATGYMGIGRVYQHGQTNLETGETCTASNGNSLGCHSGLNSLSGYMHAELSGKVPVHDDTGILGITADGWACFGQINFQRCGSNQVLTANIAGTRINTLKTVMVAKADMTLSLFGIGLNMDLPTNLNENLRFIHGFTMEGTSDFFLSFQRQQVAWPKYDKTGYAVVANAGWWMNIPYVKSTNVVGAQVNVSGIPDSMTLNNVELFSVPAVNCYGDYRYC